MVTVTGPPVVAVLLAVKVSTLEVVDEVGLKEAVTPLGRPEAESVTVPVNPFTVRYRDGVGCAASLRHRERGGGIRQREAGRAGREPVPTNVVMLCPGSEYVKESFDTLTALSCAIWLEAEVW